MNNNFYDDEYQQTENGEGLVDFESGNQNGDFEGGENQHQGYELNLPEEFQDRIEVNPDDPKWQAFQQLARQHGLDQNAVNAITAMHFGDLAHQHQSDMEFSQTQKAQLIDAFNEGGNLSADQAMQKAQGVADWAISLLKPDLERNPELTRELESIATTAAGVQLLAALKSRIGETRLPGGRDVRVGAARKSLAERLYPTMTHDPHRF